MSDNESVSQNSEQENEEDQSISSEGEDVIAELYGDEREQLEEEEGDDGEDLYGDDMMRFVLNIPLLRSARICLLLGFAK